MKVRHIASMSSGHERDLYAEALKAGEGDALLGLLIIPPDREPGTVFAYNQPCTYALGAIIARVSGGTLTDFLRTRLFEPLGITAYGWQLDGVGRELAFAGLHLPTESIAKLGQLYLAGGEWHGRQLLSREWVAEASRAHIMPLDRDPDWVQGYGFQFWLSRHGYRGDGAFGQYMLVLPEADAVVVMTAQSWDMPAVLDAVWTHLLPALTAEVTESETWPSSPLHLPRPEPSGPPGELVPATFHPGPGNELATLRTVELRAGELILTDRGPVLTVTLSEAGAWSRTGPFTTAYAWNEGRLLVDVVFLETPHRLHLRLNPASGEFEARWQVPPLGAMPLAMMRMP
jgi:hypothetical protein